MTHATPAPARFTRKLFTRTLVEELLSRALGRLADSEFVRTLLRILTETAIVSAESTAETLDVSVLIGPTHPTLQRLLTSHTPQIVGINETTRNLIRNALLRILADGGGLDEQVRAIRRIFTTASRKRAVTISRTESAIFWNGGGFLQAVDAGAVTKIWITSRDDRVRDSHMIDGQCANIQEAFVTAAHPPNYLKHPGDPDGPPEEIINCFLPGTVVRGRVQLAIRSVYAGPAREIITRSGNRLSVTPNHPILTSQGMVPASHVRETDHLVCYDDVVGHSGVDQVDEENAPTLIEDVFEALHGRPPLLGGRMRVGAFDLHGDARHVIGEVEIVRASGLLPNEPASSFGPQRIPDLRFMLTDEAEAVLAGLGAAATLRPSELAATSASPQGLHHLPQPDRVLLNCDPGESVSFGSSPQLHAALAQLAGQRVIRHTEVERDLTQGLACLIPCDDLIEFPVGPWQGSPPDSRYTDRPEPSLQGALVNPDLRGEGTGGLPLGVSLDQVVEVRDFDFSGHVYDLETDSGLVVSSNIVCSNCRCTFAPGVRPCDTRGAWLASDAARSAYWKSEIARVEERERVTLRAVRQLFADQRRDVLAVASQMMGLS